jgi:hypothetical protein
VNNRAKIGVSLVAGLIGAAAHWYIDFGRQGESIPEETQQEHDNGKSLQRDAPKPAVASATTAPKSLLVPQDETSSEERKQVTRAAVALRDPSVLDEETKRAANATLTRLGDRALSIMIDELKSGNTEASEDPAARMALVDMLGGAALSKPFVRAALEEFAATPLDHGKDKLLIHRDLIDRLEAFEFVARDAPDKALHMLKSFENRKLRRKFATHFIVGRKMAGLDEDAAFSQLTAVIRDI